MHSNKSHFLLLPLYHGFCFVPNYLPSIFGNSVLYYVSVIAKNQPIGRFHGVVGYHTCLTHRRAPDRARLESLVNHRTEVIYAFVFLRNVDHVIYVLSKILFALFHQLCYNTIPLCLPFIQSSRYMKAIKRNYEIEWVFIS